MKTTYIAPKNHVVAFAATSILVGSWNEEDRGGIDNKPKEQDEFAVKDDIFSNDIPWWMKAE